MCSWLLMRRLGPLSGEFFIQIRDEDSDKYRDRTAEALRRRRAEFAKAGGNLTAVPTLEIMAELFRILDLSQRVEMAGPSVIFDITSFPKRFFFPILRTLATSRNIRDLILTYTSPRVYADDAPLYEEIEEFRVLPGFGGSNVGAEMWIVSVGFLVEKLRRYVGDNPNTEMKLLIPFPAPLAVLKRTWESVANLEREHSDRRFTKHRVETLDMSAAFDRINSLVGNQGKAIAFAPFGPKPTSAAMCLYAIQQDSSVHYPQPTVYHPEYSKGIKDDDPEVAVSAYWIKHEGENLYEL